MATEYFLLQAPHPALASTMLLPRPQLGNNIGLTSEVVVIRMDDGSTRSFIKKADNKKRHRWSFTISSDKMEEVVDFLTRYRGETFRAEWRERIIIGKLNFNPVEVQGEGRAGGWPGGESYGLTIEIVES